MSIENPNSLQVMQQEGVRTDQTQDITNIVRLLKKDAYRPPNESSPHGDVLCPDQIWRHIIGHDTRIDDGLYVSYGLNQNIIVDFEIDNVLQKLYTYAIRALPDNSPDISQLQDFTTLIQKFLPYNEGLVTEFIRERQNITGGEFQKLGDFVRMKVEDGRVIGGGVCLQQALLAGVLLEHMIDEGKISGTVGVYRNHDTDEASGHAWAVYQSGQEAYIIDPAHASVVPVSDTSDWQWRYGLRDGLERHAT